MNWKLILVALIPVYTPLVVAGIKRLMPRLPKLLLPGLAVVGGMLADWLIALGTGTVADPALGAVYGAAGVGLRELLHQSKRALGI